MRLTEEEVLVRKQRSHMSLHAISDGTKMMYYVTSQSAPERLRDLRQIIK